jgi:hypothetical protein
MELPKIVWITSMKRTKLYILNSLKQFPQTRSSKVNIIANKNGLLLIWKIVTHIHVYHITWVWVLLPFCVHWIQTTLSSCFTALQVLCHTALNIYTQNCTEKYHITPQTGKKWQQMYGCKIFSIWISIWIYSNFSNY